MQISHFYSKYVVYFFMETIVLYVLFSTFKTASYPKQKPQYRNDFVVNRYCSSFYIYTVSFLLLPVNAFRRTTVNNILDFVLIRTGGIMDLADSIRSHFKHLRKGVHTQLTSCAFILVNKYFLRHRVLLGTVLFSFLPCIVMQYIAL